MDKEKARVEAIERTIEKTGTAVIIEPE